MRAFILTAMIFAALPLSAQTQPEPAQRLDPGLKVSQLPVLESVPGLGQLFRGPAQAPPAPGTVQVPQPPVLESVPGLGQLFRGPAQALPAPGTVQVPQLPVLELVPVLGQLFRSQAQAPPPAPPLLGNVPLQLPAKPDSGAQIQQAIERVFSGARSVLAMDLDSVLLASARKSTGGWDFELSAILKELKSIQIRMFDLEGNPAEVRSKIQPIRDLLKPPLWVRYAAGTSKQDETEIWSGRWGSTPTGVFLLSTNGKRVFTMNVGGDIRPDQLFYLSNLFGMPNLQVPLAER